jgi:hypothetical protein
MVMDLAPLLLRHTVSPALYDQKCPARVTTAAALRLNRAAGAAGPSRFASGTIYWKGFAYVD